MKQLFLSLFIFVLPAQLAFAGEPSRQVVFDHSTVTLLQGRKQDDHWQAGLEIRLPGNWKTYWKVPGDAGIPPDFDWSGSENLDSVDISWPAPRRYHDKAGESIGYKHRVVFPLAVKPRQMGKPVKLRLKLFYAACDDICIPGQATLGLNLSTEGGKPDDILLIERYSNMVPSPGQGRIKVGDVSVSQHEQKIALNVDVTGLLETDEIDIFVDGPDVAYLRKPLLVGGKSSMRSYRLIIDGISSLDQLKNEKFDIVIVSGDVALSHSLTVK